MSGKERKDKDTHSNKNKYYEGLNHNRSKEEEHSNEDKKNDKPFANLLIVDDDPDIVQVLKLGLLKNRFLVNSFTNSEEALESFKSNSKDYYSLMLSDIRMPALSGIQLARKVKEINPDVKVVLMTAFEIRDNEFSKVFPSLHIDGFVQKPIGIKDLTNKILTIIGETKRRLDES